MNTATHIPQDDQLLFALQLMPEAEMAAAHEHLLTCEDCRKQVAWIQGDLAIYALTAESQTPPAAARERLIRSVSKEKRMAPAPVATTTTLNEIPTRRDNVVSFADAPVKRRMGFAGWAGWAIAAVGIGAAGLQYQQTQGFQQQLIKSRAQLAEVSTKASNASLVLQTLTDTKAKQVSLTLASSTPAVPEAHASYLGSKGSLVFVANHLNQLDAGKTYELWLIPTGKGAKPIPAGTFNPDSQGRALKMLASLPKDIDVAAMGITVEPDGGSAAPTSPILMVGE